MENVSIVGIDLAKRSFQLHGAAADGSVVFRKKLSRPQLTAFLSGLPKCVVAMEACATSHYWGCEIGKLGHETRLIPPVYVKAFREKVDRLFRLRNALMGHVIAFLMIQANKETL